MSPLLTRYGNRAAHVYAPASGVLGDLNIFNGSAMLVGGKLSLVQGALDQAATAYTTKTFNLPFTVTVEFTETSPFLGDGFCIFITPTSTPTTWVGRGGGALGLLPAIAVTPYYHFQGVAFDNWRNINQPNRGLYQDAITGPFDTNTVSGVDWVWSYITYWEPTILGDGAVRLGTHTASVHFTSSSITVQQDGVTVFTSLDLSGSIISNPVRVGIGSATGGSANSITINSFSIT